MSKNIEKVSEVELQNIVSDNYEKIRYDKPYSRTYHLWWSKMMFDHAPAHGLWLDLGCGTGWTMDALSTLGYKRKVIGVDISSGMLKWAKSKGMNVIKGDMECLPFCSETFDVVIAKGVIHHTRHVDTAIAEISRVLKSGGVALLVDPNKSILRVINLILPNKDEHFSADHKSFSPEEYRQHISRCMKIETFRYFGFLAYPFCFPDILDIGKRIPFSTQIVKILIQIDNLISKIPGIQRLSWAYFVKATSKSF